MTNKPTYEELENRIQELEKAEQALERIFDLSPDPIGTATPDGYLIELNPAWTKILGYSKDELMSKPLFDFIHPDDVQPTKKEVERLESGKSTIFFKNRYRSKGGSYKTFEWNATASSDGMLYATARNVSEKETAEQALKESEETYRNIFKHSQVGLYRTEPATGLIIDVNDALARIAGFKDRDELLKDQWNIAEHYVDINDRLKIIEQLTTKGSFENEVALLEDRHGIQKWLRMSGTLTEKGVIEGVAENITEIKKAEDDLKGSEEKLNNMFQFADYMVCIADLQSGHFLKVSPAFTRHLGWNEEEMLSKPIIDFIHPNDIERTEETIAKQLESDDDVLQFTNRYKTKDGNFRWFEWAANPAPTEGLSYSAAYDITERVESNKALQESERLLKSIADNFPNSFLSVINEDYTIGWSGGQEFKNQGIDPNDFVGLTLENVFGENTETIRQYYDKTFAGENQEFELFINENHQLYRTVALPSNGHKRIVSVVENITERKKAEEALKESKDNFEAIVENTENAVTVIDTKGNFLYSNTNSAKNLDLKPNELNGKSIYDFFPKEFADGRVETLRKVVESKKVDSHLIETPLDGESVSFRSDMIPFRYDGK
ncbi:MAG: PAS domain S-box protein, partial [Bacteroidetes bacterium]|nr:PAS domain S-box protein [Bacteroidota bacterium]